MDLVAASAIPFRCDEATLRVACAETEVVDVPLFDEELDVVLVAHNCVVVLGVSDGDSGWTEEA